MDAIQSAKKPSGDKGSFVSLAEKKEIFEAFNALENKILKLKNAVEKG